MSIGSFHFKNQMFVCDSWPIFSVHFPNKPILPGFMQLLWVREVIENSTPARSIGSFSSVKFIKPITPSQTMMLYIQDKSNFVDFFISLLMTNTVEENIATKGSFFIRSKDP